MVIDIDHLSSSLKFSFTSVDYPPCNKDAIDILPNMSWDMYIEFINRNKIAKAKVTMPNLNGIQRCESLRFLYILPPQDAPREYDFSPLYELPEITHLNCINRSGPNWKYICEIDYSKFKGLKSLSLQANRGAKNYNSISGLKSLSVFSYKGEKSGIEGLFSSTELDTLLMQGCRNTSMNGIEKADRMKCVYLYLNRSLEDISALKSQRDTLTALRIENCPQISDFSVLSELNNLELLALRGSNALRDLSFIKNMPKLKTLILEMNVLDGNLSMCKDLQYVYVDKIRKHYTVKAPDLPRGEYIRGNESIEEWRRLE